MIIVLIYSLCMLSKFVYKKYRTKKLKTLFEANRQQIFPMNVAHRYFKVIDVLHKSQFKQFRKVVDFGCGEMRCVNMLKNIHGVEEILCVDIDRERLNRNLWRAISLAGESMSFRRTPLTIEVCEGSVADPDRKLRKTDVVICIDLIQHLYLDTLIGLSSNIFDYIKPKVVIITTPNADFAVLFFSNYSPYRNPDNHKFEWTRDQFQDWAKNIVARFPCYSVTFHGICYGPPGTKEVGAHTQMAVFTRDLSIAEGYSNDAGINDLFKTVGRYEYPVDNDVRTENQKILDEAACIIIRLLCATWRHPLDEVSLETVRSLLLKKFLISQETLRAILEEAGWIIEDREDGPVVINNSFFSESSSDNSDEEENSANVE